MISFGGSEISLEIFRRNSSGFSLWQSHSFTLRPMDLHSNVCPLHKRSIARVSSEIIKKKKTFRRDKEASVAELFRYVIFV